MVDCTKFSQISNSQATRDHVTRTDTHLAIGSMGEVPYSVASHSRSITAVNCPKCEWSNVTHIHSKYERV